MIDPAAVRLSAVMLGRDAWRRRADALVAENARLTAELAEAKRDIQGWADIGNDARDELGEALRGADQLRAALADAERWLVVPSDTYPQHYAELARVRESVRAALSSEGQPRAGRCECLYYGHGLNETRVHTRARLVHRECPG